MKTDKVILDHGSGGKLSHELITEVMLPVFQNPALSILHDGAIIDTEGKQLAFSTDTYVVDPIFFPGGDIGDLAINGTVNDIAMCGARPVALSVGMIIEEGFFIDDLKRIVNSMGKAARAAQVNVVTGDTKVVPRGAADKIFINSSGFGWVFPNARINSNQAKVGDRIILSGTMADHGITILSRRQGMSFDSAVQSDTAPLNHMVEQIFNRCGGVHVLRDPTRGGVATALNEIAQMSDVGIDIWQSSLPVRKEVAGICELLGFDPIYVANEGKLLAFVDPENADDILETIKSDPYGKAACFIGEVTDAHRRKVVMETAIGGRRIVDMLTGEQLPRIC